MGIGYVVTADMRSKSDGLPMVLASTSCRAGVTREAGIRRCLQSWRHSCVILGPCIELILFADAQTYVCKCLWCFVCRSFAATTRLYFYKQCSPTVPQFQSATVSAVLGTNRWHKT
jgi:hypothetical protein